MAPETLLSRGTGKGADLWALGVVAYEILGGVTPFYASNPLDIYENILSHEKVDDIVFPEDDVYANFGDPSVAFIKRFLHPKKTRRLGMAARGVEEIIAHPFFEGMDVEAIRRGDMSPPFLTQPKKIVTENVPQYFSTSSQTRRTRHSTSSVGSISEAACWESILDAPEDHSSWNPDF